ncbi:MAG: NEW3 domain-containing protein [Candidatus Nanohalobium sp.]
MGREVSKPVIILTALLVLSVSVGAVTFYAGVIKQTDVSRSVISDRWTGISGTVDRGSEPLSGFRVGKLSLNANQTGNVLTTQLKGVKGGGYYLAFAPGNVTEIQPSSLHNMTNRTLLERNQLFSKELFPSFYPDYSQKFDNPARTFETGKKIKLNGKYYNASYANLSGSTTMYLLKYRKGDEAIPVFVSPIDGKKRGSEGYEKCYSSGCNFQALLPKLRGSNFSYSVNLFSRGKAVRGCGEAPGNTTSVLMGEIDSGDCVRITNPGAYIDFYNTRHTGDGAECGVTVTAENVTLMDVSMHNFQSAVCVRDEAEAEMMDSNLSGNTYGIEAHGSNLSLNDVVLRDSGVAITLDRSTAELRNVSIAGTPIYGEAESVSVQGYTRSLPRPAGISSDIQPVGARIKVTGLSNSSSFRNLGLGYPDLNMSNLVPNRMYKYDGTGDSYALKKLAVNLSVNPRYAFHRGKIKNFSIFTLYGKKQTGEENSGGQSPSEGQGSRDAGGGGTGGGGSGGGAAGGGGGPSFQPTPQPVKLNLSLARHLYDAKKGDTISVEFTANNTGTVAAENVTVGLDSGWASVPKTFQVIRPNETRHGMVLVTIPEDASEGNMTQVIEAEFGDSTVDTEQFTVNVSELIDRERINVVESPPFLSLQTSTQRYVGVQVENPTNRPIQGIEARFRGGSNCAVTGNRTYAVPANSAKSVQVQLKTSESQDVCNDALVFTSNGDVLGFAPMRIELEKPSNNILSVSVYLLLLLVWTAALIWRLKTRGKKTRDRFI